jgi:putative transposase
MRYTPAEKLEIIRIVENSEISVRRTLKELGVSPSTFYVWYKRFLDDGVDGLENRSRGPRQFWNQIPPEEKEHVVDVALAHPEKSPRELAWYITDTERTFISESSVYRILKSYDLITSPHYIVNMAADAFTQKTKRPNEMWQTDFTYFKIIGWGWYYLGTVMDDYSRKILAWKLFSTMGAHDVKELLDLAIAETGVSFVKVRHKPRLLSDNGPCYIAADLKNYLEERGIQHVRGRPHHPQTQGKIERYHRTMKNVIKLQNYYLPEELCREIERFVRYYNEERYHESLDNLTPADVYSGKRGEILQERRKIKIQTLQKRRFASPHTPLKPHEREPLMPTSHPC